MTDVKRSVTRAGWGRWMVLVVLGLASVGSDPVRAQNRKSSVRIEMPTVLGFEAPITGEGGRRVALVSGSKATPSLVAGRMEVTDFRLETYRYPNVGTTNRTTEIIVESPSGTFGPQISGSDKKLTLRSAEDRFSITGIGWSWSQSTGLLVVSNAVETTVRRGGPETNRPPIQVRAGRFEYNLHTGSARFLKNCVAEDPGRARVTAGELASRLSPRQSQPDAIVATNGVLIELLRGSRPGRASGEGAVYAASTATRGERIEVLGQPKWTFGQGEGSADHLLLLPAEETYTARGHARLKLVENRKPAGAPGDAPDPTSGGASNPIILESELIEAKPETLRFVGGVMARQEGRLALSAGELVAVLGPDRETKQTTVISAKATGKVTAAVEARGREPLALSGETMTYTLGSTPRIEVDGESAWKAAGHSGRAKRFVLELDVPSFEATDAVEVTWTPVGSGEKATPVILRAARMRAGGTRAAFTGDVNASGQLWRLTTTELDLLLSTNRTLTGLDARGQVALQYAMKPVQPGTNTYSRNVLKRLAGSVEQGVLHWNVRSETLHADMDSKTAEPTGFEAGGGVRVEHPGLEARGGRLLYGGGERLMRLVGTPELRSADGLEILGAEATVLSVDPGSGALGVQGAVRRMVLPSGVLMGASGSNPLGKGN